MGAPNIWLYLEGKEKELFTIVATITAARTKFSLRLIAAGKTDAIRQSHFGDVGHQRTDHSESGWTSAHRSRRWPTWLGGIYDDEEPL
jgi:hypothetical protein